jgi:hypothetical protein
MHISVACSFGIWIGIPILTIAGDFSRRSAEPTFVSRNFASDLADQQLSFAISSQLQSRLMRRRRFSLSFRRVHPRGCLLLTWSLPRVVPSKRGTLHGFVRSSSPNAQCFSAIPNSPVCDGFRQRTALLKRVAGLSEHCRLSIAWRQF